MPWTNRGALRCLEGYFRRQHNGGALVTNWYLAIITDDVVPTVDTNVFSELTEIVEGNGYSSGGVQLTPGDTDFDYLEEDDTNDLALVQIRDVGPTAAGGSIPPSGDGGSYVVLLDDNAVIANREVLAWWSLGAERSADDGETFTMQDLEFRLSTV